MSTFWSKKDEKRQTAFETVMCQANTNIFSINETKILLDCFIADIKSGSKNFEVFTKNIKENFNSTQVRLAISWAKMSLRYV